MSCLDENQALRYVKGLLSPEREREVMRHVSACPECRWLLNEAGNAVLQESSLEAVTQKQVLHDLDEGSWSAARVRLEEASSRIGEILSDTYVIERLIGRGGMGTVYEGSHRRLPRRFAIKLLSRAMASDHVAIARIRREAEVTSRLSHPHIVDVIDFNYADDGTPFVVMELLEGQSLSQRLRQDGPLPIGEVTEIARQITSALAAAHSEGIVHRDLKPSNLFLCRSTRGIHVKVMDFGLSKVWSGAPVAGERLTRVMAVIGTPSFMSPEQADGRTTEADSRSDVFSLSATLYSLLTGSSPFAGDTIAEVLERVIEAKPAEPPPAWQQVPASVRAAILRGLEKDPDRRTQSMDALWSDLSSALGVRTSPPRQLRWWLVASAVAVAVVAVIAIVASMKRRDSAAPRRPAVSVASDAGRAEREPQQQHRDLAPPPRRQIVTIKTRPAAAPSSSSKKKVVVVRSRRRASRRRRRTPTARRRREPAVKGVGTLVMQSKSRRDGKHIWANVQLDGKSVGRSGLTLKDVPAGAHTVEFQRAGYQTVSRRVTVRPGQRTLVIVQLETKQ